MEKYIASFSSYKPEIRKVIIDKETDSFYWIAGRRSSKRTQYDAMFNSFDEAKECMLERKRNEIEQSKRKTSQLSSEWDFINKIKPQP